jgi:uncharacterized membrane protein
MDLTHVHLFLNHAPLFGVAFGLFFLLMGVLKRSEGMRLSAITLFVISALLTLPVFFTGESAEEAVEHMPGVTEAVIETHEEAASTAIWSMVILGAVSIAALRYPAKHLRLPTKLVGLVAILAVVSMGLIGRTAYLGGQIRHTEVRAGAPGAQADQPAAGGEGGSATESDKD